MAIASLRTKFSRQATLVACLSFGLVAPLPAQQKGFRPLPRYAQGNVPDQESGRRILEDFRRLAESGEGYFTFDFRVMPRRGDERRVSGLLWRGANAAGPASRIVVNPGDALAEQRWLVQGGPTPGVWTWRPDTPDRVEPLAESALFERMAGTDVTAFDLQMPFLHWTEFVFEGVSRVRGRVAQAFLLYPPADFAERNPALSGVRVYLDLEYRAMVQAEQIGADGRSLKAMTVIDLKKVGDQWIVKSIDLRDEATRDKTRFSVTGAAVSESFVGALFDPARLGEAIPPPPPGRIQRIVP